MNRYLLAILIIIILNAAYVFVQRNDAQILASENKQPVRVEILSNGQIHSWDVDGEQVRIVKQ